MMGINDAILKRAGAEVRSFISEGFRLVVKNDCPFSNYNFYKLRHWKNGNEIIVSVHHDHFDVRKNGIIVKTEP